MLVAGTVLVTHGPFELASAAARRAAKSLGRPVAIAGLQVRIGSPVTVKLRGLVIDNLPGAGADPFLRLDQLDTEIAPGSLLGWLILGRPPTVRHLSADGIHLVLGRAADGRPNWRFKDAEPAADGNGRTKFPTLLDAHLGDGDVVMHTSGGNLIRIHLDETALAAAGSDQPATLTARGTYNASPVQLTAALQSFDRLHDATVPFGAKVRLASDDTLLDFDGTLTKPIDADGVAGKLVLTAPSLDRLLAITGTPGHFAAPISLGAGFDRDGDLWRLTDGDGTLGGHSFKLATQLKEGARHAPDDFTLDAGFALLDLTPLSGQAGSGEASLRIDAEPGTLLDAHIAAKQIAYGDLKADDLDLKARLAPGALTIDRFAARFAGGTVGIGGSLKNADAGAAIQVDGTLGGADAGRLATLLAPGSLPITGAVDIRLFMGATGTTIRDAGRTVHGGLAVSMRDGSIARSIVEQASTDVRALFRKAEGTGRIECLLGVLDLHDGGGHIMPLRLRTPDGTIAGAGTLDLRRDTIDLTFASESATTSLFALDVPVRFAGPIAAPHLLPALGGPKPTPIDLDDLPPTVRDLARGNPCLTDGR
ncbi:MAG TPA: AsmA-like C-terminal region-containing protein [Aliidongia sp.]|uniref:AsmA family protein n=1 Tax=Aliidongia sp. TaxID=1914230 RepID=UPI002DDC90DB|nr:AsmA-like C-terminal region-containing protein [Aliidongia sp.]HEV2678356.1 AsmA-like C-terminal region-containing protein [Aliidongia sp.]